MPAPRLRTFATEAEAKEMAARYPALPEGQKYIVQRAPEVPAWRRNGPANGWMIQIAVAVS